MTLATDLPTEQPQYPWAPQGGRGGYVHVTYGDGGNMVQMVVRGQCADVDFAAGDVCWDPGGDSADRVAAMDAGCSCAVEQKYTYAWDELNRLAEARREDGEGGTADVWVNAAWQRYRYDGANQRVVKEVHAFDGAGAEVDERVALYVYPGDFELRGMRAVGGAYVQAGVGGDEAETQYLVAGARVVWKAGAGGAWVDEVVRDARATIAVGDVIGTTGAVVDLFSGELIEASTYYPNGGRESYRGEDDGEVGSEPMGFTGKEADEEVGVTYFGERYLVVRLGRWATPDPLAVHAVGGGEALNAYHYVAGNLLSGRDPTGLDPNQTVASDDGADRSVCANTACTEGTSSDAPSTIASSSEMEAKFEEGAVDAAKDQARGLVVSGTLALAGSALGPEGAVALPLIVLPGDAGGEQAPPTHPDSPEGAYQRGYAATTIVTTLATVGLALRGGGRRGSGSGARRQEGSVTIPRSPAKRLPQNGASPRVAPSPTPSELVQAAVNQSWPPSEINFGHILHGEVKVAANGQPRAVGGHYGRSPNVRITSVVQGPDRNGVLAGRIEIRDPATGAWVPKRATSTIFPLHWSRRQVQQEIQGAFDRATSMPSGLWEGVSPSGVRIQGYHTPGGGASTAWPVHGG